MQRYEIAGLKVDMAVSGKTQRQAAAYAAPATGEPDITIHCDAGEVLRSFPWTGDLETAEYLGTGAHFDRELLAFGGMRLHASALLLGGKAYLFSAHSGTGKSTHTEKWVRLFGAEYLNDDKPALRRHDDGWFAYGTPWSGKHDLSKPTGAPIGGIAFLFRGEENRIAPMPVEKAIGCFMAQTPHTLSRQRMDMLLPLLDSLLREIPVWELYCRNDDDAAVVSHRAMVT